MIVLDTSVLIEIEKGNKEIIDRLRILKQKNLDNVAITSAIYSELLNGYYYRNIPPKQELSLFRIFDFTKESAEILARKKLDLERNGKMIPMFDLITASCVIENNAVLITKDAHFKKVKGLNVILI